MKENTLFEKSQALSKKMDDTMSKMEKLLKSSYEETKPFDNLPVKEKIKYLTGVVEQLEKGKNKKNKDFTEDQLKRTKNMILFYVKYLELNTDKKNIKKIKT